MRFKAVAEKSRLAKEEGMIHLKLRTLSPILSSIPEGT